MESCSVQRYPVREMRWRHLTDRAYRVGIVTINRIRTFLDRNTSRFSAWEWFLMRLLNGICNLQIIMPVKLNLRHHPAIYTNYC